MASTAFNTDRRSFLAGAPSLALLTAGPAAAFAIKPNLTAWGAALNRYLNAKATADHHWRTIAQPSADPMPGHIADEADRLATEQNAAQRALMEMPAPTLAALRIKLDMVFVSDCGDDDDFMSAWSFDFVKQTMADYRRMLGDA